MSFDNMLTHRSTIKRLDTSNDDGSPDYTYRSVATNVPCRADLGFQRGGRPAGWRPEPGRPADRQGTVFYRAGVDVRPGDRIVMTSGPSGTFEVDGAVDEISGFDGEIHHIEASISEVAQPLGRT